ncbi:MAG: hypothetical protein E6K72_12110 [Candidatus Eisenbacteria bacterium]|uniref:SGNH/GDSL hydrolase family protein n=1 Tax=Eiseniibacteriota bacterium TaxID=2212470 RepID=A0A538SEE1_UNCEI|nr:MAG: hypothetical protein E6K72_12110 [Candidatus Eisenbacteria bacterium]
MSRLAGNLLVLVAGLLGGVLLLEIVLRVAGLNPAETTLDPTIGYRFIPHARYRHTQEGFSTGRFNGHGWRDAEHAYAKPPNTTRILFLGDSYVSAFQVPLDSAFYRRLERGLTARARPGRRFEVVALGADGNSTAVEYLTYLHWGVRYDPDVVAVLFILNDQADNWRPAALDKARPFFLEEGDSLRLDDSFAGPKGARRSDPLRWLKSHSVLAATVRRAITALHPPVRPPVAPGTPVEDGYYRTWNFDRRLPADSIPAFRVTEKILARFARDVALDGRRFVLVVAGFANQEDRRFLAEDSRNPDFDPEKPLRWLQSVGARHGFDVLTLTPAFRAASIRLDRPLWFGTHGHYGHWNSDGHAVAAAALEDYFAHALPGLDSAAAGPAGAGR